MTTANFVGADPGALNLGKFGDADVNTAESLNVTVDELTNIQNQLARGANDVSYTDRAGVQHTANVKSADGMFLVSARMGEITKEQEFKIVPKQTAQKIIQSVSRDSKSIVS